MTTQQVNYWNTQENRRHNLAAEALTSESNAISQQQAQAALRQAAAAERNVEINQYRASIDAMNAQTNARNADTRAFEAQTGRLDYQRKQQETDWATTGQGASIEQQKADAQTTSAGAKQTEATTKSIQGSYQNDYYQAMTESARENAKKTEFERKYSLPQKIAQDWVNVGFNGLSSVGRVIGGSIVPVSP